MALTMTEALATLRDDLDEQTAIHWTNAQLIRYMNQGLRKTARISECNRDSVTKAIVAGTYEYTMSSMTHDIIRFHIASFVRTGDTLEYWLKPQDLSSSVQDYGSARRIVNGTPRFFHTWGKPPTLTLSLYPVPAEDGTLTLYYYRLPATYNTDGSGNGTALDLPSGWEECAVLYAKYKAFKQDGQMDQAQLELQEFNDTVKALSVAATRFNDQPGQVSMFGNMGLPLWLIDEGMDM